MKKIIFAALITLAATPAFAAPCSEGARFLRLVAENRDDGVSEAIATQAVINTFRDVEQKPYTQLVRYAYTSSARAHTPKQLEQGLLEACAKR